MSDRPTAGVERPVPGTIRISDEVLAELAGYAAMQTFGVVGMASPTVRDGVAQLLARERLRKGIKVTGDDLDKNVDLYVVLEHGTSLAEVARNLQDRVRYVLETYGSVRVKNVEVHVQGIKVHKK
jgi:uncharacterized alkaline shock family protein YloU